MRHWLQQVPLSIRIVVKKSWSNEILTRKIVKIDDLNIVSMHKTVYNLLKI